MRKNKLILAIAGLLLALGLNAQNITVKGTVTDNTGEPVINAGVVVKGTLRGVSTDLDGNYVISCPSDGILVFSFIGLETQEVPVNGRAVLNVTMLPDSEFLTESVVTALGIRRDAKALGYAATTVNTEELLTANTVSPVASLQGKVAGVEINQSDGGLFGSTKIQIRGASTLSKNNQPIYVIDGVILDNAISNTGDADWDGNINDYGNQLKNLNPDDFESLTVLKGAAATARSSSPPRAARRTRVSACPSPRRSVSTRSMTLRACRASTSAVTSWAMSTTATITIGPATPGPTTSRRTPATTPASIPCTSSMR